VRLSAARARLAGCATDPLADQGDLGVAGEPRALVVPAGAGLVAAFPIQPVAGVARRAGPGGQGGEQVLDLRDGQRNHARVRGWRLIGGDRRRRLGIGPVAQQGRRDGTDR
jgi:hypothetical protein